MPNHIQNRLTIKGSEERIKEIVKDGFSFSNTVPIEDEVTDGSLVKNERLINNRLKQWGTKWDAEVYDTQWDEECTRITFSTAWYPPLGWLLTTARTFSDLQFILSWFGEDGDAGRAEVIDGKIHRERGNIFDLIERI